MASFLRGLPHGTRPSLGVWASLESEARPSKVGFLRLQSRNQSPPQPSEPNRLDRDQPSMCMLPVYSSSIAPSPAEVPVIVPSPCSRAYAPVPLTTDHVPDVSKVVKLSVTRSSPSN